jgi:hypothetical protein
MHMKFEILHFNHLTAKSKAVAHATNFSDALDIAEGLAKSGRYFNTLHVWMKDHRVIRNFGCFNCERANDAALMQRNRNDIIARYEAFQRVEREWKASRAGEDCATITLPAQPGKSVPPEALPWAKEVAA